MARIYRQSSEENRFTQRNKLQKSAKGVIFIYLLNDDACTHRVKNNDKDVTN